MARTRSARSWALGVSLSVACLTGCGGSPSAPKSDEVFYQLRGGGMLDGDTTYEVHFKPLDAPATSRTPRVVGVGVFDGDIRLGRPIDWNLRAASKLPGQRFIAYQSPRQFLFSIYERFDHPQEPWPDVLLRYERDLEAQGAQIVSARMPIATANAQGRGYFLKTKVPAKPDYVAYSHEYLVRTDARVLLVQVVHAESIEPIADEVAQVLSSLTAY